MNKLLPLFILSIIFAAGCAEKKTLTADLSQTGLPYSVDIPQNWREIPKPKVMKSGFKKFATMEGSTFDGAFTGAPTADVRMPMVAFSRFTTGKATLSEIQMMTESSDQMIASIFGSRELKATINNKSYDEDNKVLLIDTTTKIPAGASISLVFLFAFTENGYILGFGTSADQDIIAQDQIKKILASIKISPAIQYQAAPNSK